MAAKPEGAASAETRDRDRSDRENAHLRGDCATCGHNGSVRQHREMGYRVIANENKRVRFTMSKRLYTEFDSCVRRLGTTKSKVIQKLVEEWLDRQGKSEKN